MDDGDLNKSVDQNAPVAEGHLPKTSRFENDDAHMSPSRWWFASSAFPMIAGTLGPVASAFSICALVRPWRQHFPPGIPVDNAPYHPDPIWLTTINALQLVIALVANVFLLLNMARRVRFSIAQPVTFVGWYISAILLLSLNATAAGPLKQGIHPVDEYIWSQAYYYGIYAAILYFIDASLMAMTFWGASTGHYPKDFILTPSQRTLMLQTIMFLMYLLIGALVFSKIEGWPYLDGVYWADVTLFTVGFGDYAAATNLGRALLFPYALIGVISLGLVIGSIRSLVLERGKRHMDARMEEKKRRQVVRRMTKKGNDWILEPLDSNTIDIPDQDNDAGPATEYERRKAEFILMRRIQDKANSRRKWVAMGIATGTWIGLWLIGGLIFLECEKTYQTWDYYDSFYFCFVSLTTIGYGDVTPISNAGKSFFVFWSLLALPAMTVLISNAGDTVVKFVRDATIGLGNITILPGELGFLGSAKQILERASCGRLFPGHAHHAKQQNAFIGQIDAPSDDPDTPATEGPDGADGSTAERGRSGLLDVERGDSSRTRDGSSQAPSTFTSKVRRSLSRLRDPLDDLPIGTDFYFLLISEIQVVTTHLKDSNPRRYSYEEWAWYLRLIGEDERSPDTHRKPKPHDHRRGSAVEPGEEQAKWSWVGNRSPLMGSQEESEWILDKLTERLKEALSAEGRHRARTARAGWLEAHTSHAPDLNLHQENSTNEKRDR